MCLWSEWRNHILSSSRFLNAISQWLEWSLFTSQNSNSDDGAKSLNWQGLLFGDTRGKAEGFRFQLRHFSWFNCSCSQDSRVQSRWEEQQRQGQTYMQPLWQSWPFHGNVLQSSWISTRVQEKGQGVYSQSSDSWGWLWSIRGCIIVRIFSFHSWTMPVVVVNAKLSCIFF